MRLSCNSLLPALLFGFSIRVLSQTVSGSAGGGRISETVGDCISPADRHAIAAAIAANRSTVPLYPHSGEPKQYPFQPIAGTVWADRFIQNFLDLDSSARILDWDCSDFTYDGHLGHDISLRSFADQDVGTPVFAALAGKVVALHDGAFDRRIRQISGAPANYVVLDHGGGHSTFYYHLRKNSVAVTLNQDVTAGTQLGLAGSSGFSDWPHLHFESQLNNKAYEPYAGACQTANLSRWHRQTPIRRELYIEAFAMHGTNNVIPWFPEDPPRQGAFVRTGIYQPIGAWYTLHNQPANSTWRAVYRRPNGTEFFDSGAREYTETGPFRTSHWWMYFNLRPDVAGTWSLQLHVNDTALVTAPFTVLAPGSNIAKRPPNSFSAAFDPPEPEANGVVFCRVNAPLIEDPDFDHVRYRFRWAINDLEVRVVTNAAFSDALQEGVAHSGDMVNCTVTALDSAINGPEVTVVAMIGGVPPRLVGTVLDGPHFQLSWAISAPAMTLEFSTNLFSRTWEAIRSGIEQVGGSNVVTDPGIGSQRFFRLRKSD